MKGIDYTSLFKDADFLQTPKGLLIGILVLAVLWLLMRLAERIAAGSVGQLIRALRRPLIVSLAVAVIADWVLSLFARNVQFLTDAQVAKGTTSFMLVVFGRAVMVAGLRAIHSKAFNRWMQKEIDDDRERIMLIALLDRLFSIGVVFLIFSAIMLALGVSPTAVGAVLGGAGIGIGFGTQQVSQNFLSGLMLFFNRPFAEGDWINLSNYSGTVERIGWYHTRIRTFDRRPLFIPNSVFATTPIENPGRMYNRRIKVEISLRYEDINRINRITADVKTMLQNHSEIDQQQAILVNFNEWGNSSINMLVYCFTKTTVWSDWLDIQQDIFLQIADIVSEAGADFAFPSTTLYPPSSVNPRHPLFIRKYPCRRTLIDASSLQFTADIS